MPIDIHQEQLVTLCEAAKLLPMLNSKRISANAIWRWCRKGVSGIHLEHVRIGGRIFTSPDALNRFVNALAEADVRRLNPAPEPRAPAPTRDRQGRPRRSAAEAAEQHRLASEELDRAGI
jgi:hypothetical protein